MTMKIMMTMMIMKLLGEVSAGGGKLLPLPPLPRLLTDNRDGETDDNGDDDGDGCSDDDNVQREPKVFGANATLYLIDAPQ